MPSPNALVIRNWNLFENIDQSKISLKACKKTPSLLKRIDFNAVKIVRGDTKKLLKNSLKL